MRNYGAGIGGTGLVGLLIALTGRGWVVLLGTVVLVIGVVCASLWVLLRQTRDRELVAIITPLLTVFTVGAGQANYKTGVGSNGIDSVAQDSKPLRNRADRTMRSSSRYLSPKKRSCRKGKAKWPRGKKRRR